MEQVPKQKHLGMFFMSVLRRKMVTLEVTTVRLEAAGFGFREMGQLHAAISV